MTGAVLAVTHDQADGEGFAIGLANRKPVAEKRFDEPVTARLSQPGCTLATGAVASIVTIGRALLRPLAIPAPSGVLLNRKPPYFCEPS